MPAYDLELNVVWSKTGNWYTVTYIDPQKTNGKDDGTESYEVANGERTPSYSGTLYKDKMIFYGWDTDVSATVTGDVTYNAQWTSDYSGNVSTLESKMNSVENEQVAVSAALKGDSDSTVSAAISSVATSLTGTNGIASKIWMATYKQSLVLLIHL